MKHLIAGFLFTVSAVFGALAPVSAQAAETSFDDIVCVSDLTELGELMAALLNASPMDEQTIQLDVPQGYEKSCVLFGYFGSRSRLVLSVYEQPAAVDFESFTKSMQAVFVSTCPGDMASYYFDHLQVPGADEATTGSTLCLGADGPYRSSILYVRIGRHILALRAGVFVTLRPDASLEVADDDAEGRFHTELMRSFVQNAGTVFKTYLDAAGASGR